MNKIRTDLARASSVVNFLEPLSPHQMQIFNRDRGCFPDYVFIAVNRLMAASFDPKYGASNIHSDDFFKEIEREAGFAGVELETAGPYSVFARYQQIISVFAAQGWDTRVDLDKAGNFQSVSFFLKNR